MAWELLTTLIQGGDQHGSRSTVLTSLGWMAALLVAGLVGCISSHAADWILIFFATILALDFVAFIVGYAYFAVKNPEALRTERFAIQKIAIEHGLRGDSISGLFAPETSTVPKNTSQSPIQIEHAAR